MDPWATTAAYSYIIIIIIPTNLCTGQVFPSGNVLDGVLEEICILHHFEAQIDVFGVFLDLIDERFELGDRLLTLGDEIGYAWRIEKVRVHSFQLAMKLDMPGE